MLPPLSPYAARAPGDPLDEACIAEKGSRCVESLVRHPTELMARPETRIGSDLLSGATD